MVKHNNVIPNAHFGKDWQKRIRCYFNQPAQKKARRLARAAKAAAVAPRPLEKLRPSVRCQTVRYNRRVRAGRGFSLAELKAAGINPQFAQTIGISVDHRRRNVSVEGLNANVERLKLYKSKLVVFPRRSAAHPKNGDSTAAEVKTATQRLGALFPVRQPAGKSEKMELEAARQTEAFRTLRQARAYAALEGKRQAKAKAKAAAAASGAVGGDEEA